MSFFFLRLHNLTNALIPILYALLSQVMIMTVDPGEQLTMPRLNVPAVFLVIEGSGDPIESGYAPPIILRPGRAYFAPSGADPLTFTVGAAQKGPLKVHTNALLLRSSFSRIPFYAGAFMTTLSCLACSCDCIARFFHGPLWLLLHLLKPNVH